MALRFWEISGKAPACRRVFQETGGSCGHPSRGQVPFPALLTMQLYRAPAVTSCSWTPRGALTSREPGLGSPSTCSLGTPCGCLWGLHPGSRGQLSHCGPRPCCPRLSPAVTRTGPAPSLESAAGFFWWCRWRGTPGPPLPGQRWVQSPDPTPRKNRKPKRRIRDKSWATWHQPSVVSLRDTRLAGQGWGQLPRTPDPNLDHRTNAEPGKEKCAFYCV